MINNTLRALVLEHLPAGLDADDPFDAFLPGMARACYADYLVTGDQRAGLLQQLHIDRARIVSPAEFCAEVVR